MGCVNVKGDPVRFDSSGTRHIDVVLGVIRNKDGEDVTGSYAIETVAGTLKVTAP